MFQFVQRRRYYFLFSALLVGAGIVAMIISTVRTGRPFLVGVDFQSGTRFEVQFAEPLNVTLAAVFPSYTPAMVRTFMWRYRS